MGLSVEVGVLADLIEMDPEGADWLRASFAQVNAVLSEQGIAEHHEPESLSALKSRANAASFPYSFIHYLRRVYAHSVNDPGWRPIPVQSGSDPADDPIIEEESACMMSHLLCHSDCEGFYLPIPFREVVIDIGDGDRIPGGLLGSSYQLMDELVFVAPKLGVQLVDGHLSDHEAQRINRIVETESGLWIESLVWICLFEAARLSIEHQAAICFQ